MIRISSGRPEVYRDESQSSAHGKWVCHMIIYEPIYAIRSVLLSVS